MNTRNVAGFASLLAVVLALNPAYADVFTPVIASTISPEAHPIRGTDGAYHVVYELQLTNTSHLQRPSAASTCWRAPADLRSSPAFPEGIY